jgi:cobaltochelatase CobN
MHLLATTSGVIDGAAEAVDLGQSPAEIVVLSAADSEIASLARAFDTLAAPKPSLRLANLLQLQHNLSIDLYIEKTLRHAKLIVLRLLGGAGYWSYGLAEVEALARRASISLAVLPGDAQPDPHLTARSMLKLADCERLRQYLVMGGQENAAGFLRLCGHLLGHGEAPTPAKPLPKTGLYRDTAKPGEPLAGLTFYRSVIEGAQTTPIDALIDALSQRGIGCLALYVASLKDEVSAKLVHDTFAAHPLDIILNATSFAVSSGGVDDPLAAYDCPVLQVVLAGTSEENWQASSQGLGPRDLAMNVVLPELDGRIATRAISFKADTLWHEPTQYRIVTYKPVPDRIAFVADLAANWVRLRRTPAFERKVAIILANYPNKDGRIANGVGYDTPASTLAILNALEKTGYELKDFPQTGNSLIEELQQGPTNKHTPSSRRKPGPNSQLGKSAIEAFPCCPMDPGFRRDDGILDEVEYLNYFSALSDPIRAQITSRWSEPERDPFFADGAFHLPLKRYGNIIVAIQPARGYNIDAKSTYHDPALVPPHGYLAFYFWLRHVFGAHAIIHNGKHGNLEWLPGKANALSTECFPEVAFGPLPQLYPFIVNDPGEGTQAKRRSSAVIIDHLTPPLTRAETYGPLKDLEALIDEYYLASGLDRRRVAALKQDILDLTRSHGLDLDAGFTGDEDADLVKLDAYLCDLKEAQIRDGLHVLGTSPEGRLETDLLVALTRVPRGLGENGDASLIRALAKDLALDDFDPLACAMAEPWTGPKPKVLAELSADPWRSNGDTVERLELLATKLISTLASSSRRKPGPIDPLAPTSEAFPSCTMGPGFCRDDGLGFELRRGAAVLEKIEATIRPALRTCGASEMTAILTGLNGRFVAPGPSGAPTRGRLDVLPTGRNFYSLDNRTVPTPTAWTLGQKSAEDLLTRHFQDFGQYPKAIGLSAWGTSNMRTGGDDIAQALALIGARPVWEPSSWRLTGFELIPLAKLGRPRVDVTFRISGFFRDAFPAQIELLDKAIRAVGSLDEDPADNPIAARIREETQMLMRAGASEMEARQVAGYRIFGSKPGTYGAGLQALIDEKLWSERADLAHTYVTWGAYAYGACFRQAPARLSQ